MRLRDPRTLGAKCYRQQRRGLIVRFDQSRLSLARHFFIWEKHPVSIACEARINAVLVTEPPERPTQRTGIAADNRRAAMSENRSMHIRASAPFELDRDGGVAHQHAILLSHHRTSQRGAIADIDTDPAQRVRGVRKPGNVRQIKECACLGTHAISNGGCADGMLDRYALNLSPPILIVRSSHILRRSRMGK